MRSGMVEEQGLHSCSKWQNYPLPTFRKWQLSLNLHIHKLSPGPFSLPPILLFLRTFWNILFTDVIDSWVLVVHVGQFVWRMICYEDQMVCWPELHHNVADWVKAKWHAACWSVRWFVIADKCNLFIDEAMKTTGANKIRYDLWKYHAGYHDFH